MLTCAAGYMWSQERIYLWLSWKEAPVQSKTSKKKKKTHTHKKTNKKKQNKQFKKVPWDKFVKKKHLKVCEIFENYVDDVADFLELYQCLLMFLCLRYIIWWSRYATQKTKKNTFS